MNRAPLKSVLERADEVKLEYEDIDKGIMVVETSEEQHANRAVSEFVEQGMQRAMQPTPLPEGYKE